MRTLVVATGGRDLGPMNRHRRNLGGWGSGSGRPYRGVGLSPSAAVQAEPEDGRCGKAEHLANGQRCQS